MNWKTLLVLLILAGAAVYGVIELNKQQQAAPSTAAEPSLLYPQLAEQINDIQGIRIVKAGDETAIDLARKEQNWVLANKHDYPAAQDTLRELLSGLLEAKIIETKTSNPERYAALEVEDVSSADAQGVRLDLEGAAEPISLIIGKSGAGSFDQTYVRKANDAQSLLVSGALLPADDVQRWAEQPIVEIPAGRIQRVVIKHPDGEQLTVVKDGRADTNFKVFNLLEGRELSHDTVANPIGNALSNLRLEDVTTVEALDPAAEQAVSAEYYTFDGQKITVQAFKKDDKYYAHLSAAFDAEQYERFKSKDEDAQPAPADQASAEQGTQQESESASAEQTTQQESESANTEQASQPGSTGNKPEELTQQAAELDTKFKPWVYEISQYKYESMSKRLEDMLKPLEQPASDAPASSSGGLPIPGNQPATQ